MPRDTSARTTIAARSTKRTAILPWSSWAKNGCRSFPFPLFIHSEIVAGISWAGAARCANTDFTAIRSSAFRSVRVLEKGFHPSSTILACSGDFQFPWIKYLLVGNKQNNRKFVSTTCFSCNYLSNNSKYTNSMIAHRVVCECERTNWIEANAIHGRLVMTTRQRVKPKSTKTRWEPKRVEKNNWLTER